jgi:hypothetical protein
VSADGDFVSGDDLDGALGCDETICQRTTCPSGSFTRIWLPGLHPGSGASTTARMGRDPTDAEQSATNVIGLRGDHVVVVYPRQ